MSVPCSHCVAAAPCCSIRRSRENCAAPSPSTPASNSPTSTPKHSSWHPTNAAMSKHMSWSPGHVANSSPKHSVHFHDPQLLKDGVLVTKVQCRMVSAKDILGRQKSPVRLVQLSPSSSPLHLSSSSSPSTNGSSPHINYSPSKNLPSLSKNTSSEATCSPSPPIRCSPSRMKSCPLNPSPSPSSSPHHTVSRASLTTRTH